MFDLKTNNIQTCQCVEGGFVFLSETQNIICWRDNDKYKLSIKIPTIRCTKING